MSVTLNLPPDSKRRASTSVKAGEAIESVLQRAVRVLVGEDETTDTFDEKDAQDVIEGMGSAELLESALRRRKGLLSVARETRVKAEIARLKRESQKRLGPPKGTGAFTPSPYGEMGRKRLAETCAAESVRRTARRTGAGSASGVQGSESASASRKSSLTKAIHEHAGQVDKVTAKILKALDKAKTPEDCSRLEQAVKTRILPDDMDVDEEADDEDDEGPRPPPKPPLPPRPPPPPPKPPLPTGKAKDGVDSANVPSGRSGSPLFLGASSKKRARKTLPAIPDVASDRVPLQRASSRERRDWFHLLFGIKEMQTDTRCSPADQCLRCQHLHTHFTLTVVNDSEPNYTTIRAEAI